MTTDPIVILHTDRAGPAAEVFIRQHPDVTFHTCDSYDALPGLIDATKAEVVYSVRFAGAQGYPRSALLSGRHVRWLSIGGSGTDHVAGWDPQVLTVTNAAGVAAGIMAEYALGAFLHFSLDFPRFAKAQAARTWVQGQVAPIEGRIVLIIGLGKTGQAIARMCKSMKVTVLGVRARPAPTSNVDEVHGVDALAALWPRADFIAVCVPLLAATRGLIDRAAFAAMKPGVVLVDVSRGGVVIEAALVEALAEGRVKGAALDVFETEPLPSEHPLWRFENVIVTPHCSSVYEGWDLKAVAMFCDNLCRYRQDRPLENLVDPERGY